MDNDYLKASVGDALTQGLSAVAVKQPDDPVEFLGNFLIAYVDTKQKEMEVRDQTIRNYTLQLFMPIY